LEKNRLLLIPFFAGLSLMIYSWWLSYPLSITSASDVIFNHVNFLYWVSLPLLMCSMFLMAVTTKNSILKWLLAIGIVLTIYSIFYFYTNLPTADSEYFRGLSEYLATTKNLDASQSNHVYYQWPSFFILNYVGTLLSGVSLANFEFILFSLIGFLLTTSLYVYLHSRYKNGAFFAVVAFWVSIFYFIDYQAAPFSLAFAIFFIILMLETRQKNVAILVTQILLYISLLITHAFVPLFFIIYLFIRSILDRRRLYGYAGTLLLFSVITFITVQLTLARVSLTQNILYVFAESQTFSQIAQQTFVSTIVPTDVLAQFFSRTITVVFILTCVAGFIFLFIKKRLTFLDKAILITGATYSILGVVVNTLGYRAVPIALIPVSLGTAFIFESKLRKYFIGIFMILLVLFVFIPIHQSFSSMVSYQTKTDYAAENFLINNYNWRASTRIVAGFRVATYIMPKLPNYELVDYDLSSINLDHIMVYTVELSQSFITQNTTLENVIKDQSLNKVYDNGMASVEIRAH